MAYKYNTKCGPNAVDEYDDYNQWSDRTYSRSHWIEGTGLINSCNGGYSSSYSDDYSILSGITELGDGCFSNSSVRSVSLPTTLVTVGSNCFKKSKIVSIKLPDGLKKIGHNNFPVTLESLGIPKNIKEFFIDNVTGCRDLKEITVDESNKYYKSKDGILYNSDMTEILFCPNAKTGKVIIPNTVTRIGDYCFAQCKSLDMIVIPTSIKVIGNYAFQGIHIKKLNIRNSVRSIGDFCFMGAVISEEFKFSNQVTTIPNQAFNSFECHTPLTFIDRLKVIGFAAFFKCKNSSLPQTISLYEAREIYNLAFHQAVLLK